MRERKRTETVRCGRAWSRSGSISENPHPDLTGWIRTLGRIHRESQAAVYGVYKELVLTNCQYVFGRILDKETLIVAVNCDENSGAELEVSVPAEGMEYEVP